MNTVPKYTVGTYLEVTPFSPWFLFGKHEGVSMRTVPVDYLKWCLREILDAPEEFHKLIRAELHRRQHEGVETFDFDEGDVYGGDDIPDREDLP